MHRPRRTAPVPAPIDTLASLERPRPDESNRRGAVALDRNERVGPLPPWFLDEIRRAVDDQLLLSYPAVHELEAELAEVTGVPRERLLVTSGNDPAIKALFQGYVRPGDKVVLLDPTYARYRAYAAIVGAQPIGVGYDRDLTLDVEALLAAVQPGIRGVFLANPNQPTGTVLDESVLRAVLDQTAAAGTLVLVDEAYTYFSPETTALPLLDEYPNLAVARSFSKAGLAGTRIGFLAAHEDVVQNVYKLQTAGEVNGFAILCARRLLAHPEVATDYAAEVAEGRTVLARRARELGLIPLESRANFTQLRLGPDHDTAALVEALRRRGWLVRGPFREACLERCVRVTLGPPPLMEEFADALADALAGLSTDNNR